MTVGPESMSPSYGHSRGWVGRFRSARSRPPEEQDPTAGRGPFSSRRESAPIGLMVERGADGDEPDVGAVGARRRDALLVVARTVARLCEKQHDEPPSVGRPRDIPGE